MRQDTKRVLKDNPVVSEMVESWINGNQTYIVDQLWSYPPHITALFLNALISDDVLQNISDINIVTNMLMDRFLEDKGV